ncbi:MAG: nitrophenyl compound nitroreductase subunit ArsF family protein [Rickettsiales bacterium]|nr:nitrophenyl compound nitroreductase subunit ArsF family protein [Rickettsiales bacterium]
MKKSFKIIVLLSFFFCLFFGLAEAKDNVNYDLYYFMGNHRCSNCYKIESYTKEVYSEFDKKNINFKIINIDQKENEHYIKQYNLYTKSVIISKIENEKEIKYKNLDKIWNYLGSEEKFKEYIRTEINNFINNK